MIYGVDVHGRYQAGINFKLLARQGYTFAAVKATEGTGFLGPQFAPWIAQIRAAGLIPGAYHWLKAGSGAEQARYFIQQLRTAGGPDGMLIQLDCEDDATYADVEAWSAEWRRLTNDHPFFIYTGAWWWNAAGRRWNGRAITPYLWNSHYLTADADTVADNPSTFAARIPADWWMAGYGGWSDTAILQFTSTGDAGSLGNNVDLNATRLSREQLLTLTHAGGTVTWSAATENDIAFTLLNGGTNQPVHVRLQQLETQMLQALSTLGAIAAKVDIDPAELQAIANAASAAVTSALPRLADAIIAKLPAGTLTRADVEQAVRDAFAGGLAPDQA